VGTSTHGAVKELLGYLCKARAEGGKRDGDPGAAASTKVRANAQAEAAHEEWVGEEGASGIHLKITNAAEVCGVDTLSGDSGGRRRGMAKEVVQIRLHAVEDERPQVVGLVTELVQGGVSIAHV
jgi:hypothetical protein